MRLILLTFLCLTTSISISGQQKGDFPYDQEDFEFLLNSIGLDIYKFPFTSNSDESLNIIIEEYQNGRLVNTIDFYQQFLPMLKMLEKSPKDFFAPLSNEEHSWVKFYVSNKAGLIETTVKTGTIEKIYNFDMSHLKFIQSRSFDYVETELAERQPLFVIYGIESGKLLTCSGNASIKDILPMYNQVIVFYAEPFVVF